MDRVECLRLDRGADPNTGSSSGTSLHCQVGDIHESADYIEGEPRDDYLTDEVAALEA